MQFLNDSASIVFIQHVILTKLSKEESVKLSKIRNSLLALGCPLGLLAMSSQAYGAALQMFSDINYANPAELSMIKVGQLMLGTGIVNAHIRYQGTVYGVNGVANATMTNDLSYGRFAWRTSPKIVVALAVTQPVFADINFGPNSFVSPITTDTLVKTINIAPRMSYQVTPQLSLGIGLDLEYKYLNRLDFQVAGLGVVKNHSTGFFPGFDLGAFYIFNQSTFGSVSFYSRRPGNTTGTSTSESGLQNGSYSVYNIDPYIVQVHLTRIVTPKLLLSGGVYFSNWATIKHLPLKNTVLGNLTFPTKWSNVWSYELGGKYDANEHFSLLFGGMYETNFVSNQLNSIGYPGSSVLILAGGLSSPLTKKLSGQLMYARIMFAPDAKFSSFINTGSASLGVNMISARLTYDF